MEESELRRSYFQVSIRQLVPDRRRAFPLYIYLSLNQHLVLRFPADYEITASHIESCRKKGVEHLWCPIEHEADWRKYAASNPPDSPGLEISLQGPPEGDGAGGKVHQAASDPASDLSLGRLAEETTRPDPPISIAASNELSEPSLTTQVPANEGAPSAVSTRFLARSEESELALEAIHSGELSIGEKRTVLSEISTQLLSCLTAITSSNPHPEATLQAVRRCQVFTDDIIRIAAQSHRMASIYEDIRLISETHIEHSTAVAAFAVIFAMGVGYSEREALADIAFGAFLHDVGILAINPMLQQSPVESYSPEQQSQYAKHVTAALEFLKQNGIELTTPVRTIIEQHHERFDGHGFPQGIQGFQLDEKAQIVTLADLLHDLMQGMIDGRTRTPDEALNRIEKMQSSELFPTLFAPELFASAMQMIRDARAHSRSSAAKEGNPAPGAAPLERSENG